MKTINDIKKTIIKPFIIVILIILFTCIILLVMDKNKLVKRTYYKASDFNIKTLYSKKDKDKDNIDDYTDIYLGASKEINKTESNIILVINSLKNAGYYVDQDNLMEILDNNELLTTNCNDISDWQPGDIVIFNDDIGIISDKRNSDGITLVIYSDNNKIVEKDILLYSKIKKHYRINNIE